MLQEDLPTKSVQGSALALEGIDDIKCCHRLATGVLSVGDCIPDDILQEDLEDAPSLFIDESRDTLDTTTASQSTDGRLCNSLDVVSEYLSVALGTSLSCSKRSSVESCSEAAKWVTYIRQLQDSLTQRCSTALANKDNHSCSQDSTKER